MFKKLILGFLFVTGMHSAFAKGPGQIQALLEKDSVISGIPIAKGPVTYWGEWVEEGKRTLADGFLSENFKIAGIVLPKGSHVSFGYIFLEQGELALGKLHAFTSTTNLTAYGLPIAKNHPVSFTNKFVNLTLSRDKEVYGLPAKGLRQFAFTCRTEPCENSFSSIERVGQLVLSRNLILNDILFPENSKLVFNPTTGVIRSIQLPRDMEFQGYNINAGELHQGELIPFEVSLHPNGKIASGTLQKPTTFQSPKVTIAAAHFELHPDGSLSEGVLSEPQVVDGISLAAEFTFFFVFGGVKSAVTFEETLLNSIRIPKGTRFTRTANYKLTELTARGTEPIVINGVTLNGFNKVEFNEIGGVRSVSFQGISNLGNLVVKEQIIFSADGNPIYTTLAQPAIIQGIAAAPGALSFHTNGNLSSCKVVEGTRINGLLVKIRDTASDVNFYPNGNVTQFQIAEPSQIHGIELKKLGAVGYLSNGKISYVYLLAQNTVVQGIPAAEDSSVAFDESDVVKYVSKLSQDVTVNGVHFKAGTEYRKP